MLKKMLSPEIVSLIHHVELNQTGWWRKAVSQVVRGVLWKTQRPMTLAELSSALRRELGMQLTDDVLTKQLDGLVSNGSVTRLPGSNFKLSEQATKELTAAHQQAVKEQESCKVGCCRFSGHLIRVEGGTGGDLWSVFQPIMDRISGRYGGLCTPYRMVECFYSDLRQPT